MRPISGLWCAVSKHAVLLTFVFVSVMAIGGVGQTPDIRRSLGLDPAAFVILQDHINGSRVIRVRVGLTDWRLTRPVLDATGFRYDFMGTSSTLDSLSIVDAEEIWIRTNAMGPGAKYGALTLGIPSAIFGVALTLPCPEDQEALYCEASVGSAVALVAIGVALGAIVGGAIGLTQSQWKTVYERSHIVPSLRSCGFPAGDRFCVGTALTF